MRDIAGIEDGRWMAKKERGERPMRAWKLDRVRLTELAADVKEGCR